MTNELNRQTHKKHNKINKANKQLALSKILKSKR